MTCQNAEEDAEHKQFTKELFEAIGDLEVELKSFCEKILEFKAKATKVAANMNESTEKTEKAENGDFRAAK